jgi:hypothetical protein
MPATAKKTTTPIAQKKAALAAVAAKGKKPAVKGARTDVPASKGVKAAAKPARDRSRWNDSTGHPIVKGVTVMHEGMSVGTAAYFHTHYEKDTKGVDIKSKPIGFVGVESSIKGEKVGGRAVKNRSYRASDLTAVVE